jgi:RNA polymerase-binding transcription factor DksA
MNALQEIAPLDCDRPRHYAMEALRQELLAVRKILLHHVERQLPSVGAGGVGFSDLVMAERAYATLREVERTLDHMDDSAYGICRACAGDIPLERLSTNPHAMLCAGCIQERLEVLSADAL